MAINIKPSRKGLLHAKLGVPKGKDIPMEKIKAAEKSKSPALRKEANFADNARGFAKPAGDEDHAKQFQSVGKPGHVQYK